MHSSTDKKTFLLDEPSSTSSCRSRPVHNPWVVLCSLLLIVSAVFAAAFVGGYYLGKNKGTPESRESTDYYTHKAYSFNYDGNSHVIPAFRGALPVEEFIQPRAVVVNGQLMSVPGNPILTPKGTSQIFIYQYQDEVSFIVTATGQNYGEEVVNASMSGEGQYTLRTSGLQGELVQLTDGYHQMYDRIAIPDSFSTNLQWGNVGSHGYIFVLSDPSSLDATLDFTRVAGSQQPLNIRGCYQYDTEITDLPSLDLPLTITPYSGKFSLHNKPDIMSETPVDGSPDSSNLKVVRFNSNSRRRRSMATRVSHGLAFILSHPDTKEILHRIELTHEPRHGGKEGSMCWNVQNNVDRVEASFCPFFHNALYNGLDGKPSDNGSHSMLINTHYRIMNDDSGLSDTWNHAAFLVHDINRDSILSELHNNRDKRSFFGSIFHGVESIGKDIAHGVTKGYDAVKSGVKTAIHDVGHAVTSAASTIAKSYHCGWVKSIEEGGKCLKGGVECGTDIAGEDFTLGLDTVETVYSCGSAIKDCVEYGRNCF